MTPFNGDRVRPRVTTSSGGKTFSWLFDTGASVTCMTAESFKAAFPHSKPCRVQNTQLCTAASGNPMNSLGIFEIDLQIKGKTFKHSINVIDQLTDNIIGIDFMHRHKLHYDVQTHQVKISAIDINQIVAIKEQTLPALASTVIMAKIQRQSGQKLNLHCLYFCTKNTKSFRHACYSVDKNKQLQNHCGQSCSIQGHH